MKKIRVVQVGLGPIGRSVVRYAMQRPDIEIVGAVDIDKSLVGQELGGLVGLHQTGISVSSDIDAVLSQTKPNCVLLTTSSSLKKVFPQLKTCLAYGINVVSTCEELAYPLRKEPRLSEELDKLAKKNKVTVLGTGINPGFLMDAWPLFMTGVCQSVQRIKVVRIQNASPRRLPFQKKIGAGCTVEEFEALVSAGTLKHVGLPESIAMIASGLNWKLDDIAEIITPIVAQVKLNSDYITVEPGKVAGVRQVGKGIRNGEELVTLEFEASIGAPESYDAVYITGRPNMEVVIKGGTHGDIGTAAMTVNSVYCVLKSPPGLVTMKDLPMSLPLGSNA